MMVRPGMASHRLSGHGRAHHNSAHTSHITTYLLVYHPTLSNFSTDILPLLGMPSAKPPQIPPQAQSHQACTYEKERS
jgi:hypothetical protein